MFGAAPDSNATSEQDYSTGRRCSLFTRCRGKQTVEIPVVFPGSESAGKNQRQPDPGKSPEQLNRKLLGVGEQQARRDP